MDSATQQHLAKLLEWAKVCSINDLNADAVDYLKYELEGRVPITQFRVRDHEYFKWRKDHPDVVDVEYDAPTAHVVIKATTSVLYDTAINVFEVWFDKWSEEINADGSRGHYNCKTLIDLHLLGKYEDSEKQADVGLWKVGHRYPSVVVEVGINETLREDGKRWFEGTCGETKRVILMNITEEKRPVLSVKDQTWGLSAKKLRTIRHDALTKEIYDYHQKHNIPLVGERFVFDLASLRPGGRITDAIFKAPIPHLKWQVPGRKSMQKTISVVLCDNECDYTNPDNLTSDLDLTRLTYELDTVISIELPKERASKMAWDYIIQRLS
ncbi:uncharacterized protein ASPGLDRAFT_40070 [Aspergillus glaucus CBS 516.65]|uniref:Uncharacterized protein n=1 Tax=Aspergillus glaucus CBS 516.65 TaxID=1160497 RepID=A0A1L9V5N7_ASPGL|nr:hypothetical protein ASPGLDRAFT_40070 [Aspergillus glaucus CBS 516.65]OJJ79201.1 hypothetical protein ASPGLDRAFT_40070 [Aspergillus glaucus CBS 516.65]